MKTVAVILPAFNSGDSIDLQIASILSQKDVILTLFLMDDGSTDGTQQKLVKISRSFPNVRIIYPSKKLGSASASFFYMLNVLEEDLRNFQYVALADHDDIWMPHKITEGISRLEKDGSDGYSSQFCSVRYTFFSGLSEAVLSNKGTASTGMDHYFEGPSAGCTFILSAALYSELVGLISHPEVTEKLGRVFWHDWFTYMFAVERGFKWSIDSRGYIFYMQSDSNVTGVNRGLSAAVKRLKLLFSGWYLAQVVLMLDIISPSAEIGLRLQRRSFGDKLYFLRRIFLIRRRVTHCFLVYITILVNL